MGTNGEVMGVTLRETPVLEEDGTPHISVVLENGDGCVDTDGIDLRESGECAIRQRLSRA